MSKLRKPTRREVLLALASGAVIGVTGWKVGALYRLVERFPGVEDELGWLQAGRRVTTFCVDSYEADLVDLLVRGISDYPDVVRKAKGGRVVLKPNLVDYDTTRPINTDPRLVIAAVTAFRKLGAREVIVGEGPGHRRDTELMVEASGLGDRLGQEKVAFVDLNVDTSRPVALEGNATGLNDLDIADTIMSADLVVSMPKMKTHHWAGATLSMKNLFGTVPGNIVGWPKNRLHQARGSIISSIVDLWSTIEPGFAIVDGIVGMEGDGPIMGSAIAAGVLILGDHCPAVDATAARHMGLRPEMIDYLWNAQFSLRHPATIAASAIDIVGDVCPATPFKLMPRFEFMSATSKGSGPGVGPAGGA